MNFLDDRLPVRFWSKCIPEPMSGCWLWTAAVCSGGYAMFGINGGVTRGHRLTYSAFVGPIPEGFDIDHRCRVRCCVNPAHLRPLTRAQNVLLGESPPARAARVTHCTKGHPYSDENTNHGIRGRQCRTCNKAKCTEWYRQNRRAS